MNAIPLVTIVGFVWKCERCDKEERLRVDPGEQWQGPDMERKARVQHLGRCSSPGTTLGELLAARGQSLVRGR